VIDSAVTVQVPASAKESSSRSFGAVKVAVPGFSGARPW
jgi:hypothetical protein